MRMLVCCVYDAAVRAFNNPMVFRSKAEAVRSFADACTPDSAFTRHMADYSLMQIGWFDDGEGSLAQLTAPERLISASECAFDEVFPPSKKVS
jgi:hypothetical protein